MNKELKIKRPEPCKYCERSNKAFLEAIKIANDANKEGYHLYVDSFINPKSLLGDDAHKALNIYVKALNEIIKLSVGDIHE